MASWGNASLLVAEVCGLAWYIVLIELELARSTVNRAPWDLHGDVPMVLKKCE